MGIFNFRKKKSLLELQKLVITNSPNKLIMKENELLDNAYKICNNYINKISDFVQIINTTSNPNLYFQTYEIMLDYTKKLIKFEPYLHFKGNPPTYSLDMFLSQRQQSINDFLSRYYENIAKKAIDDATEQGITALYNQFKNSLLPYYSIINDSNIHFIDVTCRNDIGKKHVSQIELNTLLKCETIDNNLLTSAVFNILETESPYASMLQRRLNISYVKANTIMNYLEAKGIVSKPNTLSHNRRILICIDNNTNFTDNIDKMTGYEFEEFCCEILKYNGFENVQQTKLSGDNGIDILAEKAEIKYGIQCKCYSSKLGNKPVQEVYTGLKMYNCDIGVVMTNSYFTESAINTAKQTRIRLWDRDTLKKMLENK